MPLGAAAAAPAAAGATGLMGTLMSGLGTLGSINQLAGPQGGLVTGDPTAIAGGIQGVQSGLSGLGVPGMGAAPATPPTTQSLMGLSPQQFGSIPPEIQQELLRKLMGR